MTINGKVKVTVRFFGVLHEALRNQHHIHISYCKYSALDLKLFCKIDVKLVDYVFCFLFSMLDFHF